MRSLRSTDSVTVEKTDGEAEEVSSEAETKTEMKLEVSPAMDEDVSR